MGEGSGFRDADGEVVVRAMIDAVRSNAKALSEIDGAIGDGDHGVNMAKGFGICADRLAASPGGFTAGLRTLGSVLATEIGGAMGPLYGTLFEEMAAAGDAEEVITAEVFGRMLKKATDAVIDIGGAKVGDKTMVDALAPGVEAFAGALRAGSSFAACLGAMAEAGARGRDSTRQLAAKIGRASRLGDRSRGTLDPGATSCALILETLSSAMKALL